MRTRNTWSPVLDAVVRSGISDGLSNEVIQIQLRGLHRFYVTVQGIRRRIDRLELRRPASNYGNRLSDADRKRIVELRLAGWKLDAIAEEVGASRNGVKLHLEGVRLPICGCGRDFGHRGHCAYVSGAALRAGKAVEKKAAVPAEAAGTAETWNADTAKAPAVSVPAVAAVPLVDGRMHRYIHPSHALEILALRSLERGPSREERVLPTARPDPSTKGVPYRMGSSLVGDPFRDARLEQARRASAGRL